MSKRMLSFKIILEVIVIVMVTLTACEAPPTPAEPPATKAAPTPTEAPAPTGAERVTLLRTLSGHTDDVNDVTFSPDGKLLASGSADGTVRVWRVADWTLLHTLENGSSVLDIAFEPDGRLLGLYTEYYLELWQVTDWKLQSDVSFGINEGVSFAFSPDGKLIAHGTFPGQVKLMSMADQTVLDTLGGHTHPVADVVFSPDGQLLASSAVGDDVRLWRLSDGILLRTLGPGAYSVAFSPDGKVLASGGPTGGRAYIWQVSDGTPLHTFDLTIYDLDFSPDGALMAGLTGNNTVELWNVADWTLWHRFNTYPAVDNVTFSPDGTLLAFGSPDGSVQIWQLWP